jgi:hypothetical protein
MDNHADEMLHTLETAVNIDSRTMDESGLTAVRDFFSHDLKKHGFQVETLHQPEYGYCIVLVSNLPTTFIATNKAPAAHVLADEITQIGQ